MDLPRPLFITLVRFKWFKNTRGSISKTRNLLPYFRRSKRDVVHRIKRNPIFRKPSTCLRVAIVNDRPFVKY